MAEWFEKRLDEIAEFNPRELLKKGSISKKISMDKLQPFCRDVPGFELEPYSGGTKFRNGDTIMARITPCLENGKTAKISVLETGEVGFGSTEYIVFRAKDGCDPDFLYYLVTSPIVREPAIKSMVGSSGRQRVQTDVLQTLMVKVPDLETQQSISGILKSLDDKIAANRKINDNLVATVTAIYRRMFIEGGRIYPTAPLKQLCSKIGSGATPKGGKTAYQESGVSLVRSTNVFDYAFSYDDLAHISDEQADQLSNVIVEENDVLFNITGVSVTRCCIVPADVLPARVNQHVMILRPKTAMPMSYYIMTTLCSAENKGKLMGIAQSGSTREAINKQEMESFSIPVPPTKEVQDFEIKARGLYESVIRNTEEIMRLNVMQQLLLSQLSSR